MTPITQTTIPDRILKYCERHGYNEPFYDPISHTYYAFLGKAPIPQPLFLPQLGYASGFLTSGLLRDHWIVITLRYGGALTYLLNGKQIWSAAWKPCPLFCQENPGVDLRIGLDRLELGDGNDRGLVFFRIHADQAFSIPRQWQVVQDNNAGSIVKAAIVAVEYQEVSA